MPATAAREDDQSGASVRVFISYASEDNAVAEVLRNELLKLDLSRVEVFHDSNDLRAGEDWKETITFKLRQADWFVGLFTGKQKTAFSFPGYEVGIFETAHEEALKDTNDFSKRILCLYDTPEFPNIFNQRQNRQVAIPVRLPENDADWTRFLEHTHLMKFFSEFTDYAAKRLDIKTTSDFYDRAKERNLKSARAVVEAFFDSQQTGVKNQIFTQKRLTIKVKGNLLGQSTAPKIPDDARVDADGDSLAILGARVKQDAKGQEVPYRWGELREGVRPAGQEKVAWVEQINEVILSELDHGRDLQNYMAFTGGDGKVYRTVLARYKVYRNGAQKYYIQLIPTTPRRLTQDSKLEPIMAALVLGSQIRLLFFETREGSYKKLVFTKQDEEFTTVLEQLKMDVDKLLRDAAEHGLSNVVEVKRFFGSKRDATIDQFFKAWTQYKIELFNQIDGYLVQPSAEQRGKVEAAYEKFERIVGPANSEFIRMVVERYTDALEA